MTSTKKQILLNTVATTFQRLVIALRHIILVPFFLKFWGSDIYGEWITLSAIPTALTVCNMGLGTAAANVFAMRYFQGEKQLASNALKTGYALLSIVIAISLLGGAIILYAIQNASIITKLGIRSSTSIFVIAVLSISYLIAFFGELNTVCFRVVRKAHIAAYSETVSGILKISLAIILLRCGYGMKALALGELAITINSVVFGFWIGVKRLAAIDLIRSSINYSEMREYFHKGMSFMTTPLRRALHIQGLVIITRIWGGAEAVTILSTLRTIGNSLAQVFNLINESIYPELQKAILCGQKQLARNIFKLGTGTTIITCGLLGACLIIFGPFAYTIWTHGLIETSTSSWIFLTTGLVASSVSWTSAETLRAANRPELLAVSGIAAAVLGVVSAALLTPSLGINGALIGTIVMESVIIIYALPAACETVDQKLSKLPSDMLNTGLSLLIKKFKIRT